MIEFTLAFMMIVAGLCLVVAVLVFGVMLYDAITAKPFVSHKADKWKQAGLQAD